MKFTTLGMILIGALSLSILPGLAQGAEKTAKADVVKENQEATANTSSMVKPGLAQDPSGLLCQMGGGMMRGREGMPCGPGMGRGTQQPVGPYSSGSDLFKANCVSCHAGGGNSIMPNMPLEGSAKLQTLSTFRAYVRNPRLPNGAKGAMPAFSADKISNRQMLRLYQFLKARWGS